VEASKQVEQDRLRAPACPACRSRDTSWYVDGPNIGKKSSVADVFRCHCGLTLKPPKRDPPCSWEADADRQPTSWDRFDMRFGLERLVHDEDAALDAALDAKSRPLEIEDVRRIFAGAVTGLESAVEQEILSALALFLWGATPTLGRSWYRRDPKRSRFSSLGQAMRFVGSAFGVIGMGPVRLEIAETRRVPEEVEQDCPPGFDGVDPDEAESLRLKTARFAIERRRTGGMRCGAIHATASSHNGSTSGAKNQAMIELAHDVRRAARVSGVHPQDIAALEVMHDTDGKPDRRAAVEYVLLGEGIISRDSPKAALDAAFAEHKHRVTKRLSKAERNLERALSASPRHEYGGDDPMNDARLPKELHGLPRVPGGDVSMLRPGWGDDGCVGSPRQPPVPVAGPTSWDAAVRW
jgi:hypothetical protein